MSKWHNKIAATVASIIVLAIAIVAVLLGELRHGSVATSNPSDAPRPTFAPTVPNSATPKPAEDEPKPSAAPTAVTRNPVAAAADNVDDDGDVPALVQNEFKIPTEAPASLGPVARPSLRPTGTPTVYPTFNPTDVPTYFPTYGPSLKPTSFP
jgi:hypothetical protein